ncbi:type II secretion system minor pseudopilin GspK [Hahella sp. SMD15-11]|uniref:Type II secretion system protein K n=1 Tax=Thermohahella caldifontis TaxID=3142973 RepID=A0AB39UYS9_9GAMM
MALILVLLITALVTIVAVNMESRTALTIKRTAHHIFREQGRHLAYAAESYAREILYADWEKDNREKSMVDTLDEPWGAAAIRIPLAAWAGLEGQLDDMQGRFNINSLVTRKDGKTTVNLQALNQFKRLLNILNVSPELNAEKFVDWMDDDEEIYQFRGAEDETYLLKSPPYRAANQPFNDISELWLIDGMTEEDFKKLEPVISVLPTSTLKINVNTASREVLESLNEGIDAARAEALIEARKADKGFKDVQSFLARDELAGLGIKETGLTVKSDYFRARIKVHFDDRIIRLESLIHRDGQGKMQTVRRDFGKRFNIDKKAVDVQ